MTYVIKDRNDPPGHYTGTGWDADLAQAKRYATRDEAAAVIAKHSMPADPVESGDSQ